MSWKNDEAASGSSRISKKPWSMAARLTLWYAVTALILVSIAGSALYFGLKERLRRNQDQYLILRIQVIRSLLRERPADLAGLDWIVQSEPLGSKSSRSFARVLDMTGGIVVEAPGMGELLPARMFPAPRAQDPEGNTGEDVKDLQGKPFRVMSELAPAGKNAGDNRIVQVSIESAADRETLARFRLEFAIILAGTLVLSVLGGMTIARRGTKTVEMMSETAGRIRNTNLH